MLPMREQAHAIERAIDDLEPDAILVDSGFVGAVPLLLDDPATRPPVLAAGVVPLAQSSVDAAPIGLGLPPATSPFGRLRNRALNTLIAKVVFRRTQRLADGILQELGRPRLNYFVLDLSRLFDRFLQLSPPEFEYPRRDLTANVRFVGPVLPTAPTAAPLPTRWPELDDERPVVHVSQGTIRLRTSADRPACGHLKTAASAGVARFIVDATDTAKPSRSFANPIGRFFAPGHVPSETIRRGEDMERGKLDKRLSSVVTRTGPRLRADRRYGGRLRTSANPAVCGRRRTGPGHWPCPGRRRRSCRGLRRQWA